MRRAIWAPTRGDVLTRVILPYIKPGIFAGFFMALTYSLDDFAVTFFVTGNGFSTLSVEIYSRGAAGHLALDQRALHAAVPVHHAARHRLLLHQPRATRGSRNGGERR